MNLKIKNYAYILIGLCLLIISSCNDLIDLGVVIDGNKVEVEFEILPTDSIEYQIFAKSSDYINLDSMFKANNTTINDIESVKIKNITISILNENTDINFNQFDYIEATIQTENYPEIIIGYQDNIPLNTQKLICNYSSHNLLNYLTDSIFYLQAKGINNSIITDTILVKGVIETEINRRIL